jgi:DNA-binding CsgD family transcriptional regulator/tetratricopeptide (TPR) repeat protein
VDAGAVSIYTAPMSAMLIGRTRALSQLESALAAAARIGVVAQIVGEPGIGKSRLAEEVARKARLDGRVVMEGRAQPIGPSLPFSVFQDALRLHRRVNPDATGPTDAVASSFPARLLPELGPFPADDGDAHGVLYEAASRYFSWIAAEQGVVVLLEDLHWADPSSHALIAHLSRTLSHTPSLLLLTYRPDQHPDHSPSLHDLRIALLRERRGEEVFLEGLEPSEVDQLIHTSAPGLPDDHVAEIHRLSQGIPFVVQELARAAAEGCGPDASDLPWSVRQTLLERLRLLPTDDLALLRWAAVLGARFDLGLLQRASEIDDDMFLDSLDRLRKAGILKDDDCRMDNMGFRHALMHEAVLQELLAADRRRRHARALSVAEHMAEAGAGIAVDQLVHHAIGAGDPAALFRHSLAAARASAALGGYREALDHYERAGQFDHASDMDRAQLALEHGDILGRTGDAAAAVDRLAFARRAFETAGDAVGTAVALAAEGEQHRAQGDAETGLALLIQAESQLPANAPRLQRLRVASMLSRALMLGSRSADAIAVSRQALSLLPADRSRDETVEAAHLLCTLGCASYPSDPEAGRTALEEALDLAREVGDHSGIFRAGNNLAFHLLEQDGLPDEAMRRREEAIAAARDLGVPHEEAWLIVNGGHGELQDGRLEAVQQALAQAERLLRGIHRSMEGSTFLEELRAHEALVAGRFDEASDRLDEVGRSLRNGGRIDAAFGCGILSAAAQLGRGDRESAARYLVEAARGLSGDVGPYPLPGVILAGLAVAAVCHEKPAAAAIAASGPRWTSPPLVALVDALRDLAAGALPPPGALEAGAAELDRRRLSWQGALVRVLGGWALAEVSPQSTEAVALTRVARAWFQNIDSAGWSRAADEVLRRLGQRAPTRLGTGAEGLTARELEVLELVADGATNRQIAEKLVITPPTAARHVANIFVKLGVNSRAQATRVAGERGLLTAPVSQ